ncbi:MAG TPA: hypothetical protein VFC44_14225, partial [Candidatus Saccharimonadales bacterium]|nr:hypothetical protein [Candidatus Saccharimonadales bacterium]
ILFFANTQYEYADARLAGDLEYEREDVLLSESAWLGSRDMSKKMLLGQALAAGRPVWNYLGTFKKGDFATLRRPEELGPNIAATLAHGARAWVVDGFSEGRNDPIARRAIALPLAFQATHPDLFSHPRWAPVGVVISTRSRNILHRPLHPPHITALLQAGTPVADLRDERISSKTLQSFRVVTCETAGCLDEKSAAALAKWVRAGGTLIAATDAGLYDELGQKRERSALWQALGLETAPGQITAVGRGKVLAPEPKDFAQQAVNLTSADSFRLARNAGVEVVPYRAPDSLLLHLVRHKPAATIVLRLPDSFHPTEKNARLFVPGLTDAPTIPLSMTSEGITLTLTNVPVYSVIRIPMR